MNLDMNWDTILDITELGYTKVEIKTKRKKNLIWSMQHANGATLNPKL